MELNGCSFILELHGAKLRTQIRSREKKTFKNFRLERDSKPITTVIQVQWSCH